MNKAYNPITWANKPATTSPINATNLNAISQGLSTVDDRVIVLDSDKVTKEAGKGLSENDYTTTEKNKLAGISANAKNVAISNTLQSGDTIATITIDGTATDIKAEQVDISEYVGESPDLVSGGAMALVTPEFDEKEPYVYRQSCGGKANLAPIMKENLIGGSVVWNQLVDTNTTSVTITSGHKYIHWDGSTLTKATSDGTAVSVSSGYKFYDITQMFGRSVASQMTTAKFASLFPNYASYAYSAPTIQSTKVSSKVVRNNVFDYDLDFGNLIGGTSNKTLHNKNLVFVKKDTVVTVKSANYSDYVYYIGTSRNDSLPMPSNEYNYGGNTTGEITRDYTFTITNDCYIGLTIYKKSGNFTSVTDLNDTYIQIITKVANYDLSGSHVVNRKYALMDMGGIDWAKTTAEDYTIFYSEITDKAESVNMICDGYLCVPKIRTQLLDKEMGVYNTNNSTNYKRVTIRDDSKASLTEAQFKTAMSGVYLLYEKATPTTETVTNPTLYGIWKLDANNNLYFDGDEVSDIPNPQIVENGGTEEFIDAEVTAGNRDVSMPCGGNRKYRQAVSVPALPTTGGKVELTYNPTTGAFSWE